MTIVSQQAQLRNNEHGDREILLLRLGLMKNFNSRKTRNYKF